MTRHHTGYNTMVAATKTSAPRYDVRDDWRPERRPGAHGYDCTGHARSRVPDRAMVLREGVKSWMEAGSRYDDEQHE